MSDCNQDGPGGGTGEDTDELLYSDFDEEAEISGAVLAQRPRDHCDLLLDAIDAQLSRLRAQSHAVRARGDDGSCKRTNHVSAALSQSQSLDKDTGLGSTVPTIDISTSHLEMAHFEAQDLSSEKGSGKRDPNFEESKEEEVSPTEGAVTGEAEEGVESKREQCRWRLERLLGRAEAESRTVAPPPHGTDSVCTEDFAARFREEMLETMVSVGGDEEPPGSISSGEEHPPGLRRRPFRGEEPGGTHVFWVQRTEYRSNLETDQGFSVSGDLAVSVEGLEGNHLQLHTVPRHDRDSPQSPEVLISRVGRSQSVDRRDMGVKRTGSESSETGAIGGRELPGLHEQDRQAHSLHSPVAPAGDDPSHSGELHPDQAEIPNVWAPQGLVKPNVNKESLLSAGRSMSMTTGTDSNFICTHTSPGAITTSKSMHPGNPLCTKGSGGLTMAPVNHSLDVIAEKVNATGVRMLLRSLSCPTTAPEAKDCLSKIPDTVTPHISPSLVCKPHSPLTDSVTPLCSSPAGGGAGAGQGRSAINGVTSSCSLSAQPEGSSEGQPEARNWTALGAPSSSGTGVLTVSRSSVSTMEAEGDTGSAAQPTVRHLAGVPVKSFDSVTIDSDLDSVRTDRVRKHFQNALRNSAAVRSARGLRVEDLGSDQSDPDPVLEPRLKLSLQALRNISCGSRPMRKSRDTRRETPRYTFSDDEETDEVEEEEKEQAGLAGFNSRGQLQRNSATWRRQSSWLTGGWLQGVDSERMLLEEALSALRQNCIREEERLGQKRAQLCDTELSLSALLQQKKHAMQELERMRAEVEQAEREGRSLEASLRDSRAQADSTRSQLRMLQSQKDTHLQEMRDLEEELTLLRRHKAVLQERTGAEVERRLHSRSLSVLEREELERQLDSAKSELFAEQRRARHKVDSLQERLEETQQEVDQRVEEVRVLRESQARLEERLTDAQRQGEELEQRKLGEEQASEVRMRELQDQLEEHIGQAGALEHILAQKELQLLGAKDQHSALLAEKTSLEAELKEQHCAQLRETQEQAQRDKELELERLRTELSLAQEQQVQQVLRQAEEEKQETLRAQALSHTQRTDSLQACIQLKEEELTKLKDALEQQQESARRQVDELRMEAQEMVRHAVEQGERKWEAEKGEELRAQWRVLEEQGRRAMERVREEAERERRSSLALQKKVVELQTRLQEMESEARLQQREQAAALTAVRRAMKEEQEAELQRLHRHLEQEGQREMSRLREALHMAKGETQALQAALAERGRSQEEGVLRAEQQQKGWAAELGAECQCLQELLEHCGATRGTLQLPHNPTVAQVVQTLRATREQLCTLFGRLQQDVDSQRHKAQQLARDKERELRIQREQMAVEREQALDSLRERLIQEHIEELSGLQRTQLREGVGEPGGVAASLRRQLRDKDSELREVQRNMSRWKEQTAARLARKFEEELTAELERCKTAVLKERRAPRARMEQQRKLQRLENEMRQLTMEYGDPGVLRSTSTPSLLTVEPSATPGPPDLATFKLLRHLQSRVRQLRAENSVHTCSPVHLGTAGDLAGSYLETIAPSPESCRMRVQSHSRTGQS